MALPDTEYVPAALYTLIAQSGAGPRRIGAQMLVYEKDEQPCLGSISSGCIDDALVAEARAAIAAHSPRRLRLGSEHELMDLRLPCGSQMTLQLDVVWPAQIRREARQLRKQRKAFALEWPNEQTVALASLAAPNSVAFFPPLRILVAGQGENLRLLLRLAEVANIEALVQTKPELPALDPYTAVLTLFHDHALELAILAAALKSESTALYVGAMGSQRAQQLRAQALVERGVSPEALASLHGPIGLGLRARSPDELALSVLADLAQRYSKQCYGDERS